MINNGTAQIKAADLNTDSDLRTVFDLTTDCVIVGGGIVGLWLHNLLNARGLQTLLIEQDALGAGQTGASQGLIHSGVKYGLSTPDLRTAPAPSVAVRAIATMPARWRAHLQGLAAPNLRAVPLLCEQVFLWSASASPEPQRRYFQMDPGSAPVQRLDGKAARQLLHALATNKAAAFSGEIYQLQDFALDIDALLNVLAAPWKNRQLRARVGGLARTPHGWQLLAQVDGETGETLTIDSRAVLLCAGAGNAALITDATRTTPACTTPVCTAPVCTAPAMQLRPLHQVFVRGAQLPALFGHFITATSGSEPQLTVTTHERAGARIWSLGGALASSGVERSAAAQVERARAELRMFFPWLDVGPLQFATLRIDRAEAQTDTGQRPDTCLVWSQDELYVCWPNKLTLTPSLADHVMNLVEARGLTPRPDANLDALAQLPRPAIASPPWRLARWT